MCHALEPNILFATSRNFRQLLCTQRENHEFQSFKVFQMNLTFYSNIGITIICFYNIQSTPVFSALVVLFPHVTFKSMPGGWGTSTNRTFVHKCVSEVRPLYVVHQVASLGVCTVAC